MLDVPPPHLQLYTTFPMRQCRNGVTFLWGALALTVSIMPKRRTKKLLAQPRIQYSSGAKDLRKKVVVGLSKYMVAWLSFYQIEDVGGQRGQSLSSQCLLWGPLEHEEALVLLLLAWPPTVSTRPPSSSSSSVFSTELEKALKAAWHLPFFLFFFGDTMYVYSWEREQLFFR